MSKHLAVKGGAPVRKRPFTQWPIFDNQEEKLLLEVLHSGVWSFNGPKEKEFSEAFAKFCGAKEAFCVSNGTVSLEIALRALGIGPGDEVIVPSLTWMATALAVVCVGAVPIFADVRKEDWCIDPVSIRKNLSPRTRAIIPVHLYSQIASMDEILAIAKEHSLKIIEDCAHAHGAQWKHQSAGTIGDIGSFSFQQSKAMTSGEGGVLLTQDPNLAQKIFGLKNCGRPWKQGQKSFFGSNFRITEFQAAVLLAQLQRFEKQIETKTKNIALFYELMSGFEGISLLERKKEMTRQGLYGLALTYDSSYFHQAPKEVFIKALQAEGIPVISPYEVVYRASNWTPGLDAWKWEKGVDVRKRLGLDSHTPNAEEISLSTGFVIPHQVFLGSSQDMEDLAAAFKKIKDYSSELTMDTIKHNVRGVLRQLGI